MVVNMPSAFRAALLVCILWYAAGSMELTTSLFRKSGLCSAETATLHTVIQEEQQLNAAGDLYQRLNTMSKRIEELSAQRSKMEKEEMALKEGRDRLRRGLEDDWEIAKARLMALHKFGHLTYLAPFLCDQNTSSTMEALEATNRLFQNDNLLCFRIRGKIAELQSIERTLALKGEERKRLEQELGNQQNELAFFRKENLASLDRIYEQKGIFGKQGPKGPSNADSGGIKESLAAGVETSHNADAHPVENPMSLYEGKLPLPVEGNIIDTFGAKNHSPSRTILYNNGIIIHAPKGQSIRAVFQGRVVFAGWLKDYGKIMIIDHGERFYSLIAHADQLLKESGEQVESGDVIATVGDTGSPDGSKLYFELRRHGKPVNPMEWLAVHKSMKE
jgi:murein DD-endopeptidase MepM/ murein hydrolase activator NlpD